MATTFRVHGRHALTLLLLAASSLIAGCGPGAEQIEQRYAEQEQAFRQNFANGDYTAALAAARAAIELRPAIDEPYQWATRVFTELGRDEEAIRYYVELQQRHPDTGWPSCFRGYHEYFLSNMEAALVSFRRTTEIDPENVEGYYRQGLVLEVLGRFDEAEQALRETCRLDPDSPRNLAKLIDVLRKLGRFDEMGELIEQGLARSPDSPALQQAAGQLALRRGDLVTAEAQLLRAIELDDTVRQSHVDLARVLTLSGREAEAERRRGIAARLESYERIKRHMADYRDNPDQPMVLGEVELTERRYNDALREFARAELQGARDTRRVKAGTAEALYRSGRIPEGDAALAEFRDSDDARVILARAARRIAQGDREGGARLLGDVVAGAPEERQFLRRIADLYTAIGDTEQAGLLLERALDAPNATNRIDGGE